MRNVNAHIYQILVQPSICIFSYGVNSGFVRFRFNPGFDFSGMAPFAISGSTGVARNSNLWLFTYFSAIYCFPFPPP